MPFPDDRNAYATLQALKDKLPPPSSAADRYDQYDSVRDLIDRCQLASWIENIVVGVIFDMMNENFAAGSAGHTSNLRT
jgi:hypothetical protein